MLGGSGTSGSVMMDFCCDCVLRVFGREGGAQEERCKVVEEECINGKVWTRDRISRVVAL